MVRLSSFLNNQRYKSNDKVLNTHTTTPLHELYISTCKSMLNLEADLISIESNELVRYDALKDLQVPNLIEWCCRSEEMFNKYNDALNRMTYEKQFGFGRNDHTMNAKGLEGLFRSTMSFSDQDKYVDIYDRIRFDPYVIDKAKSYYAPKAKKQSKQSYMIN